MYHKIKRRKKTWSFGRDHSFCESGTADVKTSLGQTAYIKKIKECFCARLRECTWCHFFSPGCPIRSGDCQASKYTCCSYWIISKHIYWMTWVMCFKQNSGLISSYAPDQKVDLGHRSLYIYCATPLTQWHKWQVEQTFLVTL